MKLNYLFSSLLVLPAMSFSQKPAASCNTAEDEAALL